MKLIARDESSFSAWKQLTELSDYYTLDYMAKALRATPGSRDYAQMDCGFTSEIVSQLFPRHGQTIEVWDSEYVSFQHGILVFEVTFSYFPDRGQERVAYIRVCEE